MFSMLFSYNLQPLPVARLLISSRMGVPIDLKDLFLNYFLLSLRILRVAREAEGAFRVSSFDGSIKKVLGSRWDFLQQISTEIENDVEFGNCTSVLVPLVIKTMSVSIP